ARQLDLLFPARDVHPPEPAAHVRSLAHRAAVRGGLKALALASLLAGVVSPAAAAELIRVAVVDGVRRVELRGSDIEITELNGCLVCATTPRRASVVRAALSAGAIEIDGVRSVGGFRLQSERPIRLNGREYPPPLEVVRNGEGLAVVNELPLEEYVVGVLRAEAGEKWPQEALRAQAIVARTYGAYHRTIAGSKPYHVIASTAHQQYAGRVAAASPIWGAVRE